MMNINNKIIDLSNTDKIFFTEENISKGDVIDYYKRVSPIILPYLKDRPLTLHRFPDGISKEGFYQKQIPDYFPNWVNRITVNKKGDGDVTHVLCNNKETLVYLANQACITPHIWLSKTPELEKPNKILFDLDPPVDSLSLVVKAARELKKVLERFDFYTYLMTNGSKGIHLVVPIKANFNFKSVRQYAKKIADYVVQKNSDIFTTEHKKNKREGRVFIDYLRNSYGQTSVTPYSIRALEGAPIATPLDWHELNSNSFNPRKYSIKNIFLRLGQKEDPWKDMHKNARPLNNINDL